MFSLLIGDVFNTAGINVSAANNTGWVALTEASHKGVTAVVSLLIGAARIDANAADKQERTAAVVHRT